MPRGYRRIILAAFGCLILGQGEQSPAANKQHRHQQETAAPAPVPHSPNAPSADGAKKECYPGSEVGVSCDGISAQAAVDQARDADKQAASLDWQLRVSGATLLAAAAAAIFAWSAAYHTKRGANAAISQAEIAREIGDEQNRPYIMTDTLQNAHFTKSKFYNVYYERGVAFSIIVRNCGTTPAVNVVIYGCLGIVQETGSDIPTFNERIDIERDPGTIGPDKTGATSSRFIIGDSAHQDFLDRKVEVLYMLNVSMEV